MSTPTPETGLRFNVVNKHDFRGKGEYIGRGSLLGNTFLIGKDGSREEVIAKYRVWLWNEIKKHGEVYNELIRLMALEQDGDITLICFCKPLACHGDIIVKAIEWLGKSRSWLQPIAMKPQPQAFGVGEASKPNWAEFDALPNEEQAKLDWVHKNFEDVNPYLEDEIRDDPGIIDACDVERMQADWPATMARMAERDRQLRQPKCPECQSCGMVAKCARFKNKPCSLLMPTEKRSRYQFSRADVKSSEWMKLHDTRAAVSLWRR